MGKAVRCRQCGCVIRDPQFASAQWCEQCVRTGAPSLRHLWYQQLDEEIAKLLMGRSAAMVAKRPTDAQPGSLQRMLVYAARIAYNVPIFHPNDSIPVGTS